MKTCKIESCNNPVWSKGLCKHHIPKTHIKPMRASTTASREKRREDTDEMRKFFLTIWSKRPHYSEVSGEWLGKEPLSIYFHHILPKNKYPEAKLDEDNIALTTFDEHQNVENNKFRYVEINDRRDRLEEKYRLNKNKQVL